MEEQCALCKLQLEGASFSDQCKCDGCKMIFHTQCAKMNNVSRCIKCNFRLPIAGPSTVKAASIKSHRSSKSSRRSKVSIEIEHLRREEELFMQQQQEKQWLLEDKHKRQESFLKRKLALERQMSAEEEEHEIEHEDENEVINSIKKVEQWQSQNQLHSSRHEERSVYKSVEEVPISTKIQPSRIPPCQLEHKPISNTTYNERLHKEFLAARKVMNLDLPTFDGDPFDWPDFYDTFRTTTEKCGIQNTENLRRLKTALKGSARQSVSGLLYFPDKIDTIMKRLKDLFGRADLILNRQLERLRLEHKPVTMDSIESLIEYATKVENISSVMTQAEMGYHLWNPALLQELVEKLPSIIKLEWAEYRSLHNVVNIETFSTWLFEKAMKAALVLNKPIKFSSPKKTKASVHVHSEVDRAKKCICENQCPQLSECQTFLAMSRKDRWNTINSSRRCQICLKQHSGRCFSNRICGINNCSSKHHPLLHKHDEGTQDAVTEATIHHHSQSSKATLFKIIPVVLHSAKHSISTFAMLDDGSSISLMDDSLAKSLEVSGDLEPLCLKWTGNTTKVEDRSIRTTIQISSSSSSKRFVMKNVRTVSCLALPIQTMVRREIETQFPQANEMDIPNYFNAQPKILIGLDHPALLVNSRARFSSSGDLVAAKTRLGWTVFGSKINSTKQVFHICECQAMTKALKEFVALDNLGTTNQSMKLLSDADLRAKKLLEELTVCENGRYEVPLLWKYDSIKLPLSLNMAMRRLNCLLAKFKKDPELRSVMNDQISNYVTKGYARVLTKQEIDATSHMQCWYLPIFVVRNPNKPSKIRIVWDAAAKVGNVSLNELLLKGPDLLSNLPGVLFRFRQWAVAITGDIREMFHQIKVRKEDRVFQRFLWVMDGSTEPLVLEMQVMTFGASCSPCAAQFVKNKNAARFQKEFPRACEAITRNHYVDDLLDSVPNEEMAIDLAKRVRQIHSNAGFEIHNWKSNSPNVLSSLQEENTSHTLDLNLCSDSPLEKILGMFWNISKDCFTYSLKFNKSNQNILTGVQIPTKREILRLVMSIYDPLGFLSHFMIYPKILLQELWRKKSAWDEEISGDLAGKWNLWRERLPYLEQLEIPRHYGLSERDSIPDIHVFVDASEQAYAAVAYLRLKNNNEVKISIITAKSRVSPLKPLTIPRLELLAALLGCRLERHIRQEHSVVFGKSFFWSDSKTVLSWIKSDMRNFKPYVACRISEILEHTNDHQWNWVPTDKNIADLSTRMKVLDSTSFTNWFCAPSFLYEHESQWPVIENIPKTTEESRLIVVPENVFVIQIIEMSRFSNWLRMQRAQSWVLRFITNMRTRQCDRNLSSILDSNELLRGENWIFKQAQYSTYQDEIEFLQLGRKVVSKKSTLYKKMPFLDEFGVLRSKGRLDMLICADSDLKDAIILPRSHYATHLLILHYHNKFHHHNHETIINELKQRFYIPNLRAEYKLVRKACQRCKNKSAQPSDPQIAVLPKARLEPYTAPFSYVGIDFFGPMTVSINRRLSKRWGVIFTCLNIRAVHIEVAHSLTTDSCIIALRNFINRRGVPIEIYSDNGTNLKGSSRELREQIQKIDKVKLAENFISPDTAWYFNPPGCPHMGGAWERLVRSIKTTLSHLHIPRNPTDEILNSTLIEIENVINSRPLTYLPLDDCDSEALTPNHFLKMSSSGVRKLGECNISSDALVRNWKRSQQLANSFWKRWVLEYLPTLNRRVKWFEPEKTITVGDVVIVIDEKQDRNVWQKGLIVATYTSKDGKVRKADVKTATGVYTRPAVKLAILDVRKDSTLEPEDPFNVPGAGITSIAREIQQAATSSGHPQTN